MSRIKVLDPTAQRAEDWAPVPQKLERLQGKVIGFNVQWTSFDQFCARVEQLIKDKYHVAGTLRLDGRSLMRDAKTEQEWQAWLAKIDAAIVGLGA